MTEPIEPQLKKRRRGHGEGGIHQRADGRWVATIDLGWENGKRKRKSFYGTTRKEVARKLNEALSKREKGERVDVERQTVAQFLDRWLEIEVKPNREPATYDSYESTVRIHIVPTLGRIQLQKLTAPDLQSLLRAKERAGTSARQVSYIRTVLRIALARAVKWEMVSRNIADLVDPPKQTRHEIKPWSRSEAQQFLAVANQDRLGALFSVALALGLRKGEALGLQWADVDLEHKRLTIKHQLQRVKGVGLTLKTPKTERSRRTLVLPDPIVTDLRKHRVQQLEERLAAGGRWVETDYVFTTGIGTPIEPTNVNKHFARLIKVADVRTQRFHDQRHWCATLLLAQGVPPRLVMETLGHSQQSTLMDLYGHVLDDDRRIAADMMGAVFAAHTEEKTAQ